MIYGLSREYLLFTMMEIRGENLLYNECFSGN